MTANSKDKDIELITESLSAIAETEMHLEGGLTALVKDVKAGNEITAKAHEQLMKSLIDVVELNRKQGEEQAKLSKSLVDFIDRIEKSGLLKVISNIRRFFMWILIVIGAGLIWIFFNMATNWYVKVIQPAHVPMYQNQVQPVEQPQPVKQEKPKK